VISRVDSRPSAGMVQGSLWVRVLFTFWWPMTMRSGAIISGALTSKCQVVGYVDCGDDLIGAVDRPRPDVVTLDVHLHGQSGLQALLGLRAAFPDLNIIVVAATATPLYREEAFRRGADAYIAKPRVLSELMPAVLAKVASGKRGGRPRAGGGGFALATESRLKSRGAHISARGAGRLIRSAARPSAPRRPRARRESRRRPAPPRRATMWPAPA